MTDIPPKPKHRRRMWLVVGTLLFIVSVAGWCYLRRPDQRFVGTWEVYSDGRKAIVINTLYGDGSGCHLDLKTRTKTFFRWHASDDVFELPPDSTKLGLRGTLDSWIQRVTQPHVIGYKVLAMSENEIQMWTRNPRNQQSLVMLRRIADAKSPE